MSTTTPSNTEGRAADDAPIETIRELEDEFRRLAETDRPIASHAQTALDRLEEAETDA